MEGIKFIPFHLFPLSVVTYIPPWEFLSSPPKLIVRGPLQPDKTKAEKIKNVNNNILFLNINIF
jgi:hypothetical protein